MADPREAVVNQRLKAVRRIIAVSGGKGGVGKSLLASILALVLAQKGFRVGLFDLDFTSPSTHVVLGIRDLRPKEEKGIVPPRVHGMEYMSIVYYSGNRAAPLRGGDVSNALIELLSVVRWGELDYLVLDMPPGIGDATLDLLRLLRRVEFVVVTTPSRLAFETAKKLASLLRESRTRVIGVVENVKVSDSKVVERQVESLGLAYLGEIPYDAHLEEALGSADRLLNTDFARRVEQLAPRIQNVCMK